MSRTIQLRVDDFLKSAADELFASLGLDTSTAIRMFLTMAVETERNVVIDGSLFGMGRGAGNACTETIVNFLNTRYGKKYNLSVLLETIEKYIVPLKQSIHWGYDMPMFICGSESAHVDNVYYLTKHTQCTVKEMYEVIHSMDVDKRKRYGSNYSKNDFSVLQNVYENYKCNMNKD